MAQAAPKKIVIAERDNIAAVLEGKKVTDFFIHRGEVLLGDVYLATVDNILPSIDAAFVNVGTDKMGFLHAQDVMGKKPILSVPTLTNAASILGRILSTVAK